MNVFLPCLKELMTLIAQFRKKSTSLAQADSEMELRQDIKDAIKHYEVKAMDAGIDAESISKGKYAIVAFMDEWVLQRLGATAQTWLTNPLQLELFGETSAGERFFDILANLRLQGERYIDVLEMYYMFLELGFEGQYRLNQQKEILQLKNELLNQIQQIRKADGVDLFLPETRERCDATKQKSFPLRGVALACAVTVLTAALGAFVSIHYQAQKTREDIVHYQQALNGDKSWHMRDRY